MENKGQHRAKSWVIISCLLILGLTLFNLLVYSFPTLKNEIHSSLSQLHEVFQHQLGRSV